MSLYPGPSCNGDDVVVIGSGLTGLCTALALSEAGRRVTLVEKGKLAGESSGRALGWISGLLQAPVQAALCAAGKRGWLAIQQQYGDVGFRADGVVLIADSSRECHRIRRWVDEARHLEGIDAEFLDEAAIAERFPGASHRWPGGAYSRSDGVIEPARACVVLAEALRARGGTLLTNCAARGFDTGADGVTAVFTEQGRLPAAAVVVAANQWAPQLCGQVGVTVPQLHLVESLGRTSVVPDGPPGGGGRYAWGWRRCADGRYVVGRRTDLRVPLTRELLRQMPSFLGALSAEWRFLRPSFGRDARRGWRRTQRWSMDQRSPFEAERVYDPAIDHRSVDRALAALRIRFPAFRDTRIQEYWAGSITVSPDGLPIVSAVEELPGLFIATGTGYGVTWAPAVGRMVAALVTRRVGDLDAQPFRLDRFRGPKPQRCASASDRRVS